MKRYYTYDEAAGEANMLDRCEEDKTGRRPYFVRRHFIFNSYGERCGEFFTIHKKRYSKRMKRTKEVK